MNRKMRRTAQKIRGDRNCDLFKDWQGRSLSPYTTWALKYWNKK